MSAENKVPAIRFKGFSGEWEEKALGEVTDYKNGRGHEDKQKTYGKYELVNLNSIAIDGGLKPSGKFVDEAESTLDRNDLVMVLSDVAHGNLLGRVALIPASNTYVLNQRVALLRPSSDIFPLFILYNINAHQPYFKAQGAGMSQLNISRSSVENFSSYIPEKREQTKIGNYFQQLDTLIAQHQQKHNKLLNLKKALLEKMFPKQGTTVPEIRFKGFSGEWEEKQLEDLADIVRGASPRPIEDPKWFDKSSDVGWLRIRDVTEQGGRIYHLDQKISELGETKTRVLTENHLLLSIAASVGKPVINYVNTGVHDGFLIFKKPLFDLEYMFQWLKFFEEKWQQYGQPGSQVNLNSDIVKRQEVSMPKPEEQTKIGNLFKQLDTLLTQHQAQLKKLNNIKQACLAKMFV